MSQNRSVPTLDDVAKAAGVSTATVSRCLNTPDRVVPATRDKVCRAVEELGYTPNFGARAMAAKRTFTIGAIIPTMENAIFARGLQAFQEELHAHGYTLLVSSTGYRAEVEAEQIRALVARGADGLLLIGYARDTALYHYLKTQGVPALVAWAFMPDSALPSVGFNNRAAMADLADKVISMGHRQIGVIAGQTVGNDRASGRVQGIRDALTRHGLNPGEPTVIECAYDVESAGDAFAQLMAQRTKPTVVICGNDVLGVGALRRAQMMGLRIPQDVSITGFDDIELARIVSPALTTVHIPHHEMGRIAAQELIRMVETDGEGVPIEVKSSLQLRGSLGPPKHS